MVKAHGPALTDYPDVCPANLDRSYFLGLDLNTEALNVWTRKIAEYLKLAVTGEFRTVIPHDRFAVLVVTADAARMHSLRQHIAKQTQKLFWFSTLDTIKRLGFWSASWLRATGDDRSPPGA